MKIIVINDKTKKPRLNYFLDWLIRMAGYALVLITVSVLFKNTIQIDNSTFGVWAFFAAIIIYILNKTIKPVLVWLTLPITGITLGLFYPFINVLILNDTYSLISHGMCIEACIQHKGDGHPSQATSTIT